MVDPASCTSRNEASSIGLLPICMRVALMFTFTNLMETYAARLCVRRQRCCCQAHAVAPVQLVPFIDDAEPTGHAAGHSRTVVNVKDIYGIPLITCDSSWVTGIIQVTNACCETHWCRATCHRWLTCCRINTFAGAAVWPIANLAAREIALVWRQALLYHVDGV